MDIIDPRQVEREARKLGMSLKELSEKIKVPYSSLRRWSRGEDSPKVAAWKTASGKIEKLKAKKESPAGPEPRRPTRSAPEKLGYTARELLRMPAKERGRILAAQSRKATADFLAGGIEIFEAFGKDDYVDETP